MPNPGIAVEQTGARAPQRLRQIKHVKSLPYDFERRILTPLKENLKIPPYSLTELGLVVYHKGETDRNGNGEDPKTLLGGEAIVRVYINQRYGYMDLSYAQAAVHALEARRVISGITREAEVFFDLPVKVDPSLVKRWRRFHYLQGYQRGTH